LEILREPSPAGEREPSPLYERAEKNQGKSWAVKRKNAGCILKAEKGENEVFHGVEVFSSRPKKTCRHYIRPGGKCKGDVNKRAGLA
jgi:hypothetical protein